MRDYKKIKANMSKVDGLNKVRNVIPVNLNEGFPHQLSKLIACRYIRSKGYDFICEAKFKYHPGRADIYILDLDKVIEILSSESEEMAVTKSNRYPVKDILFLRTTDDPEKLESWLDE